MTSAEQKGRVVVVSGCGRGQGRAHVRYFAERGATVCGFDLFETSAESERLQYPMTDEDDLAKTLCLVRGECRGAVIEKVDMNDYSQLKGFADKVRKSCGNIDLLICNAAVQYVGDLIEASPATIEKVVHTNIVGTINTVKALSCLFRSDRGGTVVLIGSATSERCPPGQALYASTKGALASLARGLAVELGPRRIRVNAILPSYVLQSEISALSAVFPVDETTFYDGYPLAGVHGIPAEQISAVIEFLSSDQAAHISGVNLRVDAGKLALA